MKILFLDVDGVLNCRRTPQLINDLYPLDPFMVLLVDRIIQATGCKVVLSSAWRNHPQGVEIIKKSIPLLDKTENFSSVRGEEIRKWLGDYVATCSMLNDKECKEHRIKKYAILDDTDEFSGEQRDNFFKTIYEFGLTSEIAEKVITHLNS